MELQIVWRNPIPPPKTGVRIEPIIVDNFGAMYAVIGQEHKVSFEVILGGAA